MRSSRRLAEASKRIWVERDSRVQLWRESVQGTLIACLVYYIFDMGMSAILN